jgi:uncharacterized GH25 family protein
MSLNNDTMEEILKIVNHEVWIEVDESRAYLKWGHYPEVDGKLDPQSVVRAFAVAGNEVLPVVVGSDKTASEKGGLFLEFDRADVLAVEYDRGVYSLTEDKKWIFGKAPAKYKVKETRRILGFAKIYLHGDPKPIGLELELLPDKINAEEGDTVRVQILFRGKPIAGKIKVRNSRGVFEVDASEDGADVELAKGVNVLTARHVVEGIGVDKISEVSTLTILV